jgi:transcription antitermination factor NusG
MSNGKAWFAISVRRRLERVVAGALSAKGLTVYLPTTRRMARGADRLPAEERPLFPGYMFSHFDPRYRLPILITPGVFEIVGFNKVPAPVSDVEIENMRRLVDSDLDVDVRPLARGRAVRVTEGPLRGLHGLVVEVGERHFLTISVTLLQRSVAVQVPKHWLEPLEDSVSQSSQQMDARSRVAV